MEKRVCRVHLLASNVTPRRPWVYAVGTVGLDVNLGVFLGVLILFTEAFYVRRRSDNGIYKLNIMMFIVHSAARRVMCKTGSQLSMDFGGRIAELQDGVDL
jgi:hypothetical protein